ncbi:MAG: hypothetical protein IH589_12060 [Anaerolineales bacterium]|nr:hypothetical protein [Anaerolineales bacterium]
MKANKISIFLAVAALIASSLACALGEPTLSNVRVARDQDGTQLSTTFGATDTIYVVSDLANGKAGNVVTSRWSVVSVDGYDPGFVIDEVDLTLDEDQLSYTVYFYFEPPEGGWPAGTFQVEVFFNGTPVSTVQFTVQ